jgi:hypothetical protein
MPLCFFKLALLLPPLCGAQPPGDGIIELGRDMPTSMVWEAAFPKLDTDGDKLLTRAELSAYLRLANDNAERKEHEALRPSVRKATDADFKDLDLDGSGFLSEEELGLAEQAHDYFLDDGGSKASGSKAEAVAEAATTAAAAAAGGGGGGEGSGHDARLRDDPQARAMWQFADADGDARLAPAEYLLFHHPQFADADADAGRLRALTDRTLFWEYDARPRDGHVGLKEFIEERKRLYSPVPPTPAAGDGDGGGGEGGGEGGEGGGSNMGQSHLLDRTVNPRGAALAAAAVAAAAGRAGTGLDGNEVAAKAAEADYAALLEQERAAFVAADADGDEALDLPEWSALQEALLDSTMDHETAWLLDVCDAAAPAAGKGIDEAKDGMLSEEELSACAHHAPTHIQDMFLAHNEL